MTFSPTTLAAIHTEFLWLRWHRGLTHLSWVALCMWAPSKEAGLSQHFKGAWYGQVSEDDVSF